MLSISDMQILRDAYSPHSDWTPLEAAERIGNPADEAIVDYALSQMTQPDRNRRVLMLRLLEHQRGELAMRGLLAGLHDGKRRVCAVAIQASRNFLVYDEIVLRLETIARDLTLKRKLRRRALSMLSGDEGRMRGDLRPTVSAALKRLMADPDCRFAIVFGLVRLEMKPRVKSLLEDFTVSGDDHERALAERALRGERVIHIDSYALDEALQRRIMDNCDIAQGRMYYWLPRAGIVAEALSSY